MSLWKKFEHCRITEYALEYRICGKNGCEMCIKIVRSVKTQNINVYDINIQNEVYLPIVDSINKDQFFSYEKNGLYIENNKSPVCELMTNLTHAKDIFFKKGLILARQIDEKLLIDQWTEFK